MNQQTLSLGNYFCVQIIRINNLNENKMHKSKKGWIKTSCTMNSITGTKLSPNYNGANCFKASDEVTCRIAEFIIEVLSLRIFGKQYNKFIHSAVPHFGENNTNYKV